MTEAFLHYIWKHQLFNKKNLTTTNGDTLDIILPGAYNSDAGPDFSNARIKINNTIWAGNIEVHTDSAFWSTHKHDTDKAYDNVILHVVANHTQEGSNTLGNNIPVLEIEIDSTYLENFEQLQSSSEQIPCAAGFGVVSSFTISMWLENMCIERLESKTAIIRDYLNQRKSNWEECLYIFLARGFGLKTNALPFEMLARLTPFKLIAKYSNNLFQLEALLFGQSGLLEDSFNDEYPKRLQKEYAYLKKIHQLTSVEKHLWKFLRLRPANFPTIRIAQFANLLHNTKHLFSRVIGTGNIKNLKQLFDCEVSDYWKTHYTIDKKSTFTEKAIGKTSIYNLLINTVIPFLFIYGKERDLTDYCNRAFKYLETLPPENNRITKNWQNLGINIHSAAQSQALIQLTNNYCSKKNCLYCQIGNSIIQQKTK